MRGRSSDHLCRSPRNHRRSARRAHWRPRASPACWCTPAAPRMVFLDDQPYPFHVNAPFKLWAPITDVSDSFIYFAAGHRPRMLFHHPRDYWHKPADLPDAYWIRHFELHAVSDRQRRAHPAARRSEPHGLSRRRLSGARGVGRRRNQSRRAGHSNGLCPRGQNAVRARVPARSQPPRRAGPRGRAKSLLRRRFGIRDRAGVHAGMRPARAGAAVQPHHRAQRRRSRSALPDARTAAPERAALAAHRRRRRVRRICQRHHSHLLARGRRLRRAGDGDGPRPAGPVHTACARAWTGETCTSHRIA